MSVLEENYNPLVSIIVPAYNVEPYLKNAWIVYRIRHIKI